MSGTSNEKVASDQSRPLVLNRRNCTYQAPYATSAANSRRPARESGVVLGSEIMWNAKIIKAPLVMRCAGIVRGSPTQRDRPKSTAA